MRTRLHANATTTPRTRAEIQASQDPVAVLARRHGVSQTTIRRWRGRATTEERSHVRHHLGQATTPGDEVLIAELRRRAGLSLDDITEVMRRCVHPDLSRSSVWTALRRVGLSGRARRAAEPSGLFEEQPFGYVHVDLRYLSKLQGKGEYAFVAIERQTRFVYLEVIPDRSADTVTAAWRRFLSAFGHPVHTVLTDNGSEFTDRFGDGSKAGHAARPTGRHAFDRLCAEHGIRHRLTRPYRPQTNGMAERFNRRIGEAMGAKPKVHDNSRHGTRFASHAERAIFLKDFVYAYNRTRLRCLDYKAPLEVLTNLNQHNTRAGVFQRHQQKFGGMG